MINTLDDDISDETGSAVVRPEIAAQRDYVIEKENRHNHEPKRSVVMPVIF